MRGIYNEPKVWVVLQCLRKTHHILIRSPGADRDHCGSAVRCYMGIGRMLSMTDDGFGQCSQGGQKPLDQTKSGTVDQWADNALDHDSSFDISQGQGSDLAVSKGKRCRRHGQKMTVSGEAVARSVSQTRQKAVMGRQAAQSGFKASPCLVASLSLKFRTPCLLGVGTWPGLVC